MASKVEDDSTKPPLNNAYPPQHHPAPYPPPPPYPGVGYPPPYPCYPNQTYQYAAGAPPPPVAAYYLPGNPEQSHGYTFARVMFLLMIVFIVGMTAMSLVTWLVYGSDIPVFRVDSLEMPAFNVTNTTTFKAKWVANVSAVNPNRKFSLFFDNIETALIYKNSLLDTSFAEAFQLGTNERKTFRSGFETHSGQDGVENWVKKEMEKDRSKGVMGFDLGISLSTAFRSDSVWRKKSTLKIMCEDLEVVFPPGGAGGGIWSGGNFKDCLVWT